MIRGCCCRRRRHSKLMHFTDVKGDSSVFVCFFFRLLIINNEYTQMYNLVCDALIILMYHFGVEIIRHGTPNGFYCLFVFFGRLVSFSSMAFSVCLSLFLSVSVVLSSLTSKRLTDFCAVCVYLLT